MVKHDVLERSYGGKCVNYCALKETIAKTCKRIQETRDLKDFVEKNVDNGAKCCLDSFSGRRRRGCLNFPSLGSPHGRKSEKNTHWKDPTGGAGVESWPWTARAVITEINLWCGRPPLAKGSELLRVEFY